MEAKVINILSAKWREKLFSVPVIFQRKLRYALVSMKKSSKFQLIFYEFYFLNQKNVGIFLHLFLKWFLSVTCVLKTIIFFFLNRNRQSVYLKSNKLVYLQWTIMYIVKKKMLYLGFFLIFIRKSKPNNIQEYRSRSGPFSKPKRKKKVNVNRVIAT